MFNLKEDKPGWQKAEPIERFFIKYYSKNNLPTHKSILPNHREKVQVIVNAVCVTDEANQNFTRSQKELHRWHFRLTYWVSTCVVVDSYRASEGISKFKGSDQL